VSIFDSADLGFYHRNQLFRLHPVFSNSADFMVWKQNTFHQKIDRKRPRDETKIEKAYRREKQRKIIRNKNRKMKKGRQRKRITVSRKRVTELRKKVRELRKRTELRRRVTELIKKSNRIEKK
jgi:hypothetical protein